MLRSAKFLLIGTLVALMVILVGSHSLLADDGAMLRKPVSKTPDLESEKAQLSMMQFYLPATRASGYLVAEDPNNPTNSGQIEYWADDPLVEGVNQGEKDTIAFTRGYAKPLIVTYWDEAPQEVSVASGVEIGLSMRRDAFAAISLDDGETWKERNLSESALESSFDVVVRDTSGNIMSDEAGAPVTVPYPGDVPEVVHAVAGNKILVAWTSKYCDQGSPRYSLADTNGDGIPDQQVGHDPNAVPLYPDPFGVGGKQRSIDYYDWMHHGEFPFREVGEIPFSCVWTARGTVERVMSSNGTPDDPSDDREVWGVRWRKAERLTSGRRDAFYIAADGVEGAGFVLTWQEDPEGLRPGYGEGPGIGWSGATVNHKTDIWYSYIGWNDFDAVEDPLTPGVPAVDPDLLDTNKPKVFERMAMPVRISDNEKCEMEVDATGNILGPKVNEEGKITTPYCYDLDMGDGTPAGKGTPDGIGDLCPVEKSTNEDGTVAYTIVNSTPARIVDFVNARGKLMKVCVSDDGRMLNGQTGSSRTRVMLEGYTKPDGTKSAWVVMAYEESKGLGEGHAVDPVTGERIPALDIGKDVMYHSFDMFHPDMAAAGHMLNMPETASPELLVEFPTLGVAVGDFLPLIPNDLAVARAGGDKTNAVPNQYQTMIGRRPSLIVQPASKITAAGSAAAGLTSAVVLYKDGSERQGGPSDIFMRRFVIPAGFNPSADNPYDVKNIQCSLWDTSLTDIVDPTYPRTSYPYGVCKDGEINLSATTPLTFEALGNDADGTVPQHGITQRVLTWEQTDGNLDEGGTDDGNLNDEHWVNKYEVAKGHRGFIDGNFLMIMYAYSPNWLATSHGHEPYNLYIRRSFDGGLTWTTTPAGLGGAGTTYDQVFGVGDRVWTVTRVLGPGEFEPARNVSQLTSNKETVLDPRYSPTNMGTQSDVNRVLQPDGMYSTMQPYPESDVRDPSKFFAVFETGDATTVLEGGEADPLDLFYSRAINWGDDWDTVDWFARGREEWEERWDWLENKAEDLSGEASMAASPGGDFMWVVWNQWKELDGHAYDSDPIFRRLWWDDNEDPIAAAGGPYTTAPALITLDGTGTDPDGDEIVSFRWDLDSDGIFETAGQQVNFPATGAAQAVALQVCDSRGACDVDATWVNRPDPHTPRVWRILPDPHPVLVGSPVNLSGRFSAPGSASVTSVVWNWGDNSVPEPGTMPVDLQGKGAAFVTGSHMYLQAGIYPVTLTVTDAAGRTGFDTEYIAVYDPNAGFVTGEGQFASPAGALFGTEQTGTMGFQLDAKYDSNLGYLKGQATMSLDTGGLAFQSTSVESLVIELDGMSHLRGAGTLNGTGGYEFLLTLKDGGKIGDDLARVRIWHTGAGKNGHVFYDSQPGAPIGADATQPLGAGDIEEGGNITLHASDGTVPEEGASQDTLLYLPIVDRD